MPAVPDASTTDVGSEEHVELTASAVEPADPQAPAAEDAAAPDSAAPDHVAGLIAGIAEILAAPFAPLASTSNPLVPAGEPAAWALMAAARRELDQAFEAPSLDAPAAPEIVAAALPPADQSLYTGQPSLISQLVTVGLRVVDFVLAPFGGLLAFTSLDVPIFTDGIPPFFLTYGLDVQRTEFEGMKVWTLTPASPSGKVIVGLHGGAYVAEASLFHWWTYTDMARDTGATVVVPLYPLVPEGTAAEVVPTTADFIAAMISEHGAENVSVLGDSAGGGLALAAMQELVKRGTPVPSRLVLLAPWLDATVSDPRSAALDADDPLLDVPNLQRAGAQWAGELGADHPWASPLNGSLAGMPPTTVISGSLDLLTADSLRLLERTQTEGLTNFTFHFHNGQVHDWPIFAFIPDAIATRPQIYQGLLGP